MSQITDISKGVRISVKPEYKKDFSRPNLDYYIFSYTIKLINENTFPVKLLSRKWVIFDSLADTRIVRGDGVVGQQPLLDPGDSHEYTSSCDIISELGTMHGYYTFKNMETGELMRVDIPKFKMEVEFKMN